MKSYCLNTLFLPQDHIGVNISEALQSILESWSLPENKLACITTDNGSNVTAAVEILGWNGLSCFGHNLHLAITNSMKDDDHISSAIGIAHKIVGAFAHSWKKKRDLIKVQTEMDLPHHSLVTECTTRWGTHYKILDRILEQERALVQILGADTKTAHLKPLWQDTEVIESIVSALKSVSDLTDVLSREERVTASYLKQLLNHLQNEALAEKEEDITLKSDIQLRIKQYMKVKDDESVMSILKICILKICCCLDPRFMLKHCNDDETIAIRQSIIQQGIIIARRMEEQQPPRHPENERQEESTDVFVAPVKMR